MPTNPANSISTLKKRVDRFLSSDRYSREEIREVIEAISPLGDMAIFGGAIRDLGLRGNEYFPRDVDMVVATKDIDSLDRSLARFNKTKNRFGGYRLSLGRWKADLWPLHLTWAFREDYFSGNGFRDLLKTTFFDWDAVLYELSTGSIVALDGYLERLRSGVVDLNFEPNPNPIGATVRILRFCISGNGRLAPRLTHYLHSRLLNFNVTELILAERGGYEEPILTENNICNLRKKLEIHVIDDPEKPFGLKLQQLSLIE